MSEATTVLTVSEMDLSPVSQCIELNKQLANEGPAFKFSFSLFTEKYSFKSLTISSNNRLLG